MKTITALIKNDKDEVCHTIKDIVRMALARNEMLKDTKNYITNNYKDYKVEFVVKTRGGIKR